MHRFYELEKLTLEKTPVIELDQVFIELKRTVEHPLVGKTAIEIDPYGHPAAGGCRTMTVPLPGHVEKCLARLHLLGSLRGLQFALATQHKNEAKFTKHASVGPIKSIVRGMARTRVGLSRQDAFPAGMRDIKWLLKQAVAQRESMGVAGRVSHFEHYMKNYIAMIN
jgi:hypothetical protein